MEKQTKTEYYPRNRIQDPKMTMKSGVMVTSPILFQLYIMDKNLNFTNGSDV